MIPFKKIASGVLFGSSLAYGGVAHAGLNNNDYSCYGNILINVGSVHSDGECDPSFNGDQVGGANYFGSGLQIGAYADGPAGWHQSSCEATTNQYQINGVNVSPEKLITPTATGYTAHAFTFQSFEDYQNCGNIILGNDITEESIGDFATIIMTPVGGCAKGQDSQGFTTWGCTYLASGQGWEDPSHFVSTWHSLTNGNASVVMHIKGTKQIPTYSFDVDSGIFTINYAG